MLKNVDMFICTKVYGGIFNLLKTGLGYGHSTTFVSGMDMVELREALKPNTKMFWMEVASNPLIRIFDLKKIIGVVKSYNKDIIIVVDNTMLSPYIVLPLEFGADVVFHSCTKYLCGHSDIILGCLVTNQESIYQNLKQVQRCRGATPSAFDCYLLARSLQTLEIRMKRHHETGLKVAHFLSNHKYVEDVMHPLLGSHPDQALTMTQNSGLHSGMVSFKIKGGKSEAAKFLDSMKVISHAASFGGAHSLACLPASITHIFLTAQEKEEAGITDSLIRVSVGLENSRDLITDLDQALKRAKA
jgi:cystathionine gamma-lyase